MKMTEKRKALRRNRIANPMGQPEVEKLNLGVNWDFGTSVLIPDNTSDLMCRIGILAREIAVLAAFVDPEKKDDLYFMDQMEALAVFAGVCEGARTHWGDVPLTETIEIVESQTTLTPSSIHKAVYPAPRKPSPMDFSREAMKARDERTEYMEYQMRQAVASSLSRQYKENPEWMSGSDHLDGWLLAIDRLAEAIAEFKRLKLPMNRLREKVKARVKILKPGCARPDVLLPPGSRGGRPQQADRKYAQDLAINLMFPNNFYPAHEFEAWTCSEMAQLFIAIGFKQFGTVAAVRNLMNSVLKRRRRRPYSKLIVGPHAFHPPHIHRKK